MIRFFSHIRQRRLLEGKVTRYLGYAIGEIVLIMVGILSALQVNDWKEEQKLNEQRLRLIEHLKIDFRANLERLDTALESVEELVDGLNRFLKISRSDNSEVAVEEIQEMAGYAFSSLNFRPALSAYQAALSTGSFGLLEDIQLKELFIDFEDRYAQFIQVETLNTEYHFLGELVELRRELGTKLILYDPKRDSIPQSFRLTDDAYRALTTRKDVYAYFETRREFRVRERAYLRSMKATAEKILLTLENLNF